MKNVEDMYPLSPMQEFMLLHTVSGGDSDVLNNQFVYSIDAPLDIDAYVASWRALVARHAALRTAFLWKNLRRPVQVVRQSVDLPVTVHDWRNDIDADSAGRLETFCIADRAEPLDPSRAPLMRVALIRRSAERWWLVWTSHHLVIDRWCLAPIFAQLDALYRGAALPAHAPPFKTYIRWLKQRNDASTATFWREVLAGFRTPTDLAVKDPSTTDSTTSTNVIDGARHAAVAGAARRFGVSVNTLIQAGMALTMNRVLGLRDIVVGATVAGRPPDLPGVESIVGSFVNNLPVRIRLPAQQTVAELLRSLQDMQHRRLAYEHVSPAELARVSDMPAGVRLFDTLLVGLGADESRAAAALPMQGVSRDLKTAYPVTISSEPGDGSLLLSAVVAAGWRARTTMAPLLDELARSLAVLADADASATLADLPGFDALKPLGGTRQQAHVDPGPNIRGAGELATGDVVLGREGLDAAIIDDLVRAQWQQVLGTDTPPGDRDFFDLGGTSLQAAQLHAGIEASLRLSVPMLTLYQSPTIDGMVRTLVAGHWPLKADIVVSIRERGSLPALFCIASPEVNTVGYALLARHLNPGRPVHVLQSPPQHDRVRRLGLEEIPVFAAEYVDAMRAVQPNGPYLLLGMCTGSHIAVEMARQMHDAGVPAAFCGVVNTWGHFTVSRRYHLQRAFNRTRYYRRRIVELVRASADERAATLKRAAGRRLADARNSLTMTASDRRPRRAQVGEWIEDAGWAHLDPGEKPGPVTVTVFRLRRQPWWRIRDASLGWRRVAATVRIELLDGDDHDAIMRQPQVGELAARVERAFAAHDETEPASTTVLEPLGG